MKGASTVPKLKEVTIGDFIIWLNPRVGKMKRFLCSDWLPLRARWANRTRSEFPADKESASRKSSLFGHFFYKFLYRSPCSVTVLDIGIMCP